MAKIRNTINVDLNNIKGSTEVIAGHKFITDQEPVAVPAGEERADITLHAKDVEGDTTVIGGHLIKAITFNARLDELVQELLAHYAADPETRRKITVLADELAHEAQLLPAERDTGRARRWLDGLQQFALQAGAGASGQLLAEAFRTFFLA